MEYMLELVAEKTGVRFFVSDLADFVGVFSTVNCASMTDLDSNKRIQREDLFLCEHSFSSKPSAS